MSTSPLLGGDIPPHQPSGSDVASLGPSDLSDSGSDVLGALDAETLDSDSDSLGTGERGSVDGRSPTPGADILPDPVEAEDEDTDEDLQAELAFEQDRRDAQVAEQAEEAAARDLGGAHGVDRPEDVEGLAQEPDEPGDEAEEDGAA